MTESLACSSCGHAFSKGDRFCPQCGTAASMGPETSLGLATDPGTVSSHTCKGCGGTIGSGDRFCPQCGTGRDADATVILPAAPRNAQAARLADATRGEFEVLGQLGTGAMGSVFLARDIALSRKVAIKVIASNLLQDESMVSRFHLEAQTVASLRHPNIVNVHAVRQADDLHYFVMDFIDGPPLRGVIQGYAPLEIPVVQALLYQVGSALDYAHHRGRGVIHRDIKPANIMVDREGDAFVTDFGISKISEAKTGLTQTGATIGTPEYMSPEQCRGEELTGASDQYSLGIVAYQMICGRTPFSGSQYHIMVAHTSEEPTPIMQLRPECPPHVAEAVHRMLQKAPAARFPDLESAMLAMGGKPIGRRDPVRTLITELAATTQELRALDTSSPLSPVPGAIVEAPTSITVLGVPARVEEGDMFQLSADVRGATQGSMSGVAVAWESTDPSVAVVTSGAVRTLKEGTAIIKARVGDVTHSVSVVVSPAVPVSLAVSPARVEVGPGERTHLSAVVRDKHGRPLRKPVRWLTSNPSVASVSTQGEVVATGVGEATITADSGGVTGTAHIAVDAGAATVEMPVGTADLRRAAAAAAATPRPTPSSGSRRGWGIAAGVVLLGALGLFGANQAGLFGERGTEAEVPIGAAPIEAAATPGEGNDVNTPGEEGVEENLPTGPDSDPSSEANGGEVVAEGTPTPPPPDPIPTEATATETTQTGTTPTETTEAPPPTPVPSSLDLSQVPTALEVRQETDLSLIVLDQEGRPIAASGAPTWRSGDTSILDIKGRAAVAVRPGTTNIDVTYGDLTGQVQVTVTADVVAVVIPGRSDRRVEQGETGRLTAAAQGPGGIELSVPIEWTSSASSVLRVRNGEYQAMGPGRAVVTARAEGHEASVTVTVVAPAPEGATDQDAERMVRAYVALLGRARSLDTASQTLISLHRTDNPVNSARLANRIREAQGFELRLDNRPIEHDRETGSVEYSVLQEYGSRLGSGRRRWLNFRANYAFDSAREQWMFQSVSFLGEG